MKKSRVLDLLYQHLMKLMNAVLDQMDVVAYCLVFDKEKYRK